jgi:L-rhamnose mutarotase
LIKIFKRYCKTLQLQNDPLLIEEYKRMHAIGNGWPEITEGMKEVGIIDMEIYLSGTTVFMIMDTEENFEHDVAMRKLASSPRQSEWEAAVSKYQESDASLSAKEKWKLIERIYKMDQKEEFKVEEGYVEQIIL